MNNPGEVDYASFEAALEWSKVPEAELVMHPGDFRELTGGRAEPAAGKSDEESGDLEPFCYIHYAYTSAVRVEEVTFQ